MAGPLAAALKEIGAAEIQEIVAEEINDATKAVALDRGFVAPAGMDLEVVTGYTGSRLENDKR